MKIIHTLKVSQPEAETLFATRVVPPPVSAHKNFPTVTDLNWTPVPS